MFGCAKKRPGTATTVAQDPRFLDLVLRTALTGVVKFMTTATGDAAPVDRVDARGGCRSRDGEMPVQLQPMLPFVVVLVLSIVEQFPGGDDLIVGHIA